MYPREAHLGKRPLVIRDAFEDLAMILGKSGSNRAYVSPNASRPIDSFPRDPRNEKSALKRSEVAERSPAFQIRS